MKSGLLCHLLPMEEDVYPPFEYSQTQSNEQDFQANTLELPMQRYDLIVRSGAERFQMGKVSGRAHAVS